MWPSRYWWPWDTAENFWLGCFLPFPGSWGFSVRLHQCAAPTHQSSPGDSIALVNYSLLLTLLSAQVAVEITTDLSLGSLSSRSLAGNTWPQVSAVSADTGGVHLLPAAFYSQGRSRHPSASWKRLCTSAAKRTSKLCYTVASVIREQAENWRIKKRTRNFWKEITLLHMKCTDDFRAWLQKIKLQDHHHNLDLLQLTCRQRVDYSINMWTPWLCFK